jgi:putative acetyltransferase
VIVRRESPGDAEAVRAVHAAAFAVDRGRAEHGQDVPFAEVAEVRLVDELGADGDLLPRLCLVAATPEAPDAVVGSVIVSGGAVVSSGTGTAGAGLPMAALGPVGVLPTHQRRRVGTALLHAVLGASDAADVAGVALLGDPAFYGRFGFRPGEELGVRPPVAAWGAHFQVRPLTAWPGDVDGVFRYPPAFERL